MCVRVRVRVTERDHDPTSQMSRILQHSQLKLYVGLNFQTRITYILTYFLSFFLIYLLSCLLTSFLLSYLLFSFFVSYLLTYSMQQIPSLEANRFSASQETSRILYNPNVNYPIHKCLPSVIILSQINAVQTSHPTS